MGDSKGTRPFGRRRPPPKRTIALPRGLGGSQAFFLAYPADSSTMRLTSITSESFCKCSMVR